MAPHLLLAIFDCDGVLVDSEPIANAVLTDFLAAEGLTMTVSECRRRYVGLSIASVVAKVEAELGRSLADDWTARLQGETFARLKAQVRAVRGAREAILGLEKAGLRTCVASSGSMEKMTLTLGTSGLLPLVNPRLFSVTMVERGKPHPDLFLLAARIMGVALPYCVVIEDSVPGVQAAVAAGMKVFGYAGDPETDGAALAAAGAAVFHDMASLPGLVLGTLWPPPLRR